jgi:hypothetical protein
MDKKEITMDSPEFKAIKEATNELSAMICEYIAGKGFSVPHGLTVMAGATIAVIETVCEVMGDDAGEMMQTYIDGLQGGWKNEMDVRKV